MLSRWFYLLLDAPAARPCLRLFPQPQRKNQLRPLLPLLNLRQH
nr:MAG TPA: hypothetical protein [Caudoviricetes sp.]